MKTLALIFVSSVVLAQTSPSANPGRSTDPTAQQAADNAAKAVKSIPPAEAPDKSSTALHDPTMRRRASESKATAQSISDQHRKEVKAELDKAADRASSNAGLPRRILFIGNSLIGYQNLPGLFEELAEVKGFKPYVENSIRFGMTLADHLADRALVARLSKFDTIVIQDYSDLALRDEKQFRDHLTAVRKLTPNAHVYLFENWPYRDSPADTGAKIDRIYTNAAPLCSCTVVPVGRAMNALRSAPFSIYRDVKHPAPIATYMNTLILLKALMGISPVGMPHQGSTEDTTSPILGEATRPPLVDLDRLVGASAVATVQATAEKYAK